MLWALKETLTLYARTFSSFRSRSVVLFSRSYVSFIVFMASALVYHLMLRNSPPATTATAQESGLGQEQGKRSTYHQIFRLFAGYMRVAGNGSAHAVVALSNFLLCMDECVKIFIARHVGACLDGTDLQGAEAPSVSNAVMYEAPLVMALLALNGIILERVAPIGRNEAKQGASDSLPGRTPLSVRHERRLFALLSVKTTRKPTKVKKTLTTPRHHSLK